MPPRPITSPQALSLLCLLQCLGLSSLSPPTLPDSRCTSLPASLHRSLSLSHTHFPISGSLLLTPPPPPHRPPSHHHSFLDRFVVYLTAQHLHLSLASTVIAFDLAGRRRQSSRAPSSLFAPNLHPSSPSPHPPTHARTRLRTAPHVHTHFDLVTITPATGHHLHRSSHLRYTTRRRERLPFCAASSTTLASRPDDQSTSGRQDNKEPLGLTSSFGGNLRQRLCIVAAAGTGISKERYFFVIS